MDVERVQELQQQAAMPLLSYLRHREADRAKLYWSEIGSAAVGRLYLEFAGGDRRRGDVPLEAMDALSALRAEMAEPSKGAWLSTLVEVDASARLRMRFNYDHRPYWNIGSARFEPPQTDEAPMPGDAAFVADLQRFPREARLIPDWYPQQVDVHSVDELITDSLSVPVLVDEYAGLTDVPLWQALAEQIVSGTASALAGLSRRDDLNDPELRGRFHGRATADAVQLFSALDPADRDLVYRTAANAGLLAADGPLSDDDLGQTIGDLLSQIVQLRTNNLVGHD